MQPRQPRGVQSLHATFPTGGTMKDGRVLIPLAQPDPAARAAALIRMLGS